MSGRVLFSLFAISAQNRRTVFFSPIFFFRWFADLWMQWLHVSKTDGKNVQQNSKQYCHKSHVNLHHFSHIYVLINKLILYTSPIFMQCILFLAIKIKSEVSWVLQQKKLLFSLTCQSEWHQTITRWGGSVWGLYHLHCFCNYTCFCHVNYAIVF